MTAAQAVDLPHDRTEAPKGLDVPAAASKVRDSKAMYAVIETGGKQYRVEPGQTVVIDKLAGDEGAAIEFDRVMLVSSGDGADIKIGQPLVAGAKVEAKIVAQDRSKKLVVFKFRRRKNYVRRNGHRQQHTAVQIDTISA